MRDVFIYVVRWSKIKCEHWLGGGRSRFEGVSTISGHCPASLVISARSISACILPPNSKNFDEPLACAYVCATKVNASKPAERTKNREVSPAETRQHWSLTLHMQESSPSVFFLSTDPTQKTKAFNLLRDLQSPTYSNFFFNWNQFLYMVPFTFHIWVKVMSYI